MMIWQAHLIIHLQNMYLQAYHKANEERKHYTLEITSTRGQIEKNKKVAPSVNSTKAEPSPRSTALGQVISQTTCLFKYL